MTKNQLFAVTALFKTSDEIIHASHECVKKGYTRFDCNTPYPVHGLDKAMKNPASKLGYVALIFGFLGAITAISFITWVTSVDYPMTIGGKPFWSWPAFVPVSFELTVLFASVLSTIFMIVFYFKFPNTSHPLHDTTYMKGVSSDKFGITIQSDDPIFDEKEVTNFLRSLGGDTVAPIYFEEQEFGIRHKIFDTKFAGLLIVVALTISVTTYGVMNFALYEEPFNWMMEQNKLKAQAVSDVFKDSVGMRLPVSGTVARGFIPYAFQGKPDSAEKYLINPLLPTDKVIERGKQKFLTFCSPCHGNFGGGDSRLRGQFPNPPTLHTDKARTMSDGRIYHIITEGQNIMPGYASQIARDDRWAIIQYVRVLQRAHNATLTDMP